MMPPALRVALGFLTRLPVAHHDHEATTWHDSLAWYPVVGGIIGALMWLGATLEQSLWPAGITAALVLAAWVMITGGLHLDGLGDTADAWVGGLGDRERTLRIMKDPHAGVAAISAIVTVLICKYALLAALFVRGDLWPLLVAPVIARLLPVVLFTCTPYARAEGGLGYALQNSRYELPTLVAAGVVAAILFITKGLSGILLVAGATAALFWWWRAALLNRLGGTTGDTAGALIEVAEAVVLLACMTG